MIAGTVTGNLGKDAEIRDAGGDTVCSFSVASNTKRKGEKCTTWVRCSLWGRRGATLAQYLTKGKWVAVFGELEMREYNGNQNLEMRVDNVDFGPRDAGSSGTGRGDSGGRRNDSPPADGNGYGEADGYATGTDDEDSELPF
jgi:single stranded DNA-binding protein